MSTEKASFIRIDVDPTTVVVAACQCGARIEITDGLDAIDGVDVDVDALKFLIEQRAAGWKIHGPEARALEALVTCPSCAIKRTHGVPA